MLHTIPNHHFCALRLSIFPSVNLSIYPSIYFESFSLYIFGILLYLDICMCVNTYILQLAFAIHHYMYVCEYIHIAISFCYSSLCICDLYMIIVTDLLLLYFCCCCCIGYSVCYHKQPCNYHHYMTSCIPEHVLELRASRGRASEFPSWLSGNISE